MAKTSGSCQPASGAAWSRGADLVLDQRQVVQRIEDQVLALIGAPVPDDHLGRAADHHLIDGAADQHLAMTVGYGHGVVVVAVAHQRQRAHPTRAPVTGLIRCRRQCQKRGTVAPKPLADRLSMTPQPRTKPRSAARLELGVEGGKAGEAGQRHHEVAPDEADQVLHLAFVITLAGSAKAVREQVVGLKFGEDPGPLPRPVPQDPRHRQPSVVIQDRARHAREEGECRNMPVAERFRRLRRVGLHEAAIAVRQIEGEEVQLPRHPADHRPRLAEVHLGMAQRMHQRHEHLSRADTPLPDVVLHYGVAAGEAVLVAQTLEDPLRRVPLLGWARPVLAAHDEAFACLQDLLDPSSFATTVVKAFREWGQGLLRLAPALVRENAALERENATRRDRIAELERSAALDSTTSSKPPASDGLRKKSGTQRRTRSQRGKSGRPSGGQPGHKGTTLARTESPDHVVDHDPSACSGCGAPLSDADRHRAPVCRQVFDVPEPRPLEVTEHRAHRCLCGACATVTGAVFPDGVTAPVQYGPRITAWVSYLLYAQFVPEKRLAELMSDLFAVSISTATITAMGRRTARRFEPFLAHVADVIRTAVPVKHLDETGLRIAARTRWLHVLCTPFLTVLRIGAGRGDVEKDLEGILIHDDYAAYFTLKGVRHGACNAHHLRELQALIDIEKEDWAKSMHRLLERAHRATRFSRENGRDVPASLVARISRAWARILDHAIAFHEAQPPLRTGKRGRKKRRIGHNLALRLRKHKEGCLRFLTDPRTPFTNNEAERDLRMAKLRQKISGGFRSERGAYNFARMRAVIATARKQGWNVLQTLVHPDPMQLIPQLRL